MNINSTSSLSDNTYFLDQNESNNFTNNDNTNHHIDSSNETIDSSNETIDSSNEPFDNTNVTRPSNLYFNPLRLNDDQFLINKSNTCEYYTNDEFNQASISSNNKFSILNLNIRSMSKKFNKLKEYLDIIDHKFSIIAIQETWFKSDTSLDYYKLPDYSLETINRIDSYIGGVGL